MLIFTIWNLRCSSLVAFCGRADRAWHERTRMGESPVYPMTRRAPIGIVDDDGPLKQHRELAHEGLDLSSQHGLRPQTHADQASFQDVAPADDAPATALANCSERKSASHVANREQIRSSERLGPTCPHARISLAGGSASGGGQSVPGRRPSLCYIGSGSPDVEVSEAGIRASANRFRQSFRLRIRTAWSTDPSSPRMHAEQTYDEGVQIAGGG